VGAEPLTTLVQTLEGYTGQSHDKRVSYTKVTINPVQAGLDRPVTAYSRTHLPLEPHTDSSYMANPHDLVAFQCDKADVEGGETLMMPVEHVLENLSKENRQILSESSYDFGRGNHAILFERGNRTEIRYYRGQLNHSLTRTKAKHTHKQKLALEALDTILSNPVMAFKFKLKPGEAVLMNNKCVMHGRTGFAPTSDRLFYRIRHAFDLEKAYAGSPSFLQGFVATFFKEKVTKPKLPHVKEDFSDLTQNMSATPDETWLDELIHQEDTDIGKCKEAADYLLRRGRFKEAEGLYQRILSINPNEYQSRLSLAALEYYLGKEAEAELNRREIAVRFPIRPVKTEVSDKKRILRVRSLKGIKYSLQNGSSGYHKTLQRGHFSLEGLMKHSNYTVDMCNVYDETVSLPIVSNKYDLIINTISCGDRMRDSLSSLNAFLSTQKDTAIINHPDYVLQSTRGNNYERLKKVSSLVFPRTFPFSVSHTDIQKSVKTVLGLDIPFPFIVRPQATHTGVGMKLIRTETELENYFHEQCSTTEFYAIEWHDHADTKGLYNKIRVFCIDGVYYPVAHLMHNDWNVHSGDRYTVMDKNPFLQDIEKRFLAGMPEFLGDTTLQALAEVQAVLKLDFFGVDFTLLPDGRPYIFECNAAMRHNYDHAQNFPYTQKTLNAVSEAFDTMVMHRASE